MFAKQQPINFDTNLGTNRLDQSILLFLGQCTFPPDSPRCYTDSQINQINDASIRVTGIEIKPRSELSQGCTIIWGSVLLFPIFFVCCNWWKKCTHACYDIPQCVYQGLARLIKSGSLRNVTINIEDNHFGAAKANILCEAVSQSELKGFTLINNARGYDLNDNEYSDFKARIEPIKQISSIISDIRWNDESCK